MVPGGIFGQSKRAAGYGKLLNDSYERRIAQERAQQKAVLERVAASRPKPQPKRMEVKPYTPTTVERIRSGVRDFGNALGANGDQWSRAIDYLPLVGDGVSLAQAQDDYSRGNYLGAAGNAALGAVGLVPGGGDVAAAGAKALAGGVFGKAMAAAPAAKGIRAFHGSPHDFEQFNTSRIGTGTGVSAFGHGINLSQSERVAKDYRDTLSSRTAMVDGAKSRGYESPAHDVLLNAGWDVDGAIKKAEDEINHFTNVERSFSAVRHWQPILEQLQAWKATDAVVPNRGNIYEVNINANEADFLDWEKPIAEQSETVKAALAGLGLSGDAVSEIYNLASSAERYGSPEAAAKVLSAAGIPGVKYLGDSSRNGGQYAQNFSVFDDKLLEIVRKYGLLGSALGGGGLAAAMSTQEPQAGY